MPRKPKRNNKSMELSHKSQRSQSGSRSPISYGSSSLYEHSASPSNIPFYKASFAITEALGIQHILPVNYSIQPVNSTNYHQFDQQNFTQNSSNHNDNGDCAVDWKDCFKLVDLERCDEYLEQKNSEMRHMYLPDRGIPRKMIPSYMIIEDLKNFSFSSIFMLSSQKICNYFPNYKKLIPSQLSLNLILLKLRKGFYDLPEEIHSDIEHLINNFKLFFYNNPTIVAAIINFEDKYQTLKQKYLPLQNITHHLSQIKRSRQVKSRQKYYLREKQEVPHTGSLEKQYKSQQFLLKLSRKIKKFLEPSFESILLEYKISTRLQILKEINAIIPSSQKSPSVKDIINLEMLSPETIKKLNVYMKHLENRLNAKEEQLRKAQEKEEKQREKITAVNTMRNSLTGYKFNTKEEKSNQEGNQRILQLTDKDFDDVMQQEDSQS